MVSWGSWRPRSADLEAPEALEGRLRALAHLPLERDCGPQVRGIDTDLTRTELNSHALNSHALNSHALNSHALTSHELDSHG